MFSQPALPAVTSAESHQGCDADWRLGIKQYLWPKAHFWIHNFKDENFTHEQISCVAIASPFQSNFKPSRAPSTPFSHVKYRQLLTLSLLLQASNRDWKRKESSEQAAHPWRYNILALWAKTVALKRQRRLTLQGISYPTAFLQKLARISKCFQRRRHLSCFRDGETSPRDVQGPCPNSKTMC